VRITGLVGLQTLSAPIGNVAHAGRRAKSVQRLPTGPAEQGSSSDIDQRVTKLVAVGTEITLRPPHRATSFG
jgi:hypothetical protein